MSTSGWGEDYTIVAGADLSGQQYKMIGATGVLATSPTNPIGVVQNKPQSGEHATMRVCGISKITMAVSVGAGAFFGQSAATSGMGAIVTSGGMAFGRIVTGCDSGMIATGYLYGAPTYIAL